jgi:putative transposase
MDFGRKGAFVARKRFTAEQIIGKLREAEVETSRGMTVAESIRKLEITGQTYFWWWQEYGGLWFSRRSV